MNTKLYLVRKVINEASKCDNWLENVLLVELNGLLQTDDKLALKVYSINCFCNFLLQIENFDFRGSQDSYRIIIRVRNTADQLVIKCTL